VPLLQVLELTMLLPSLVPQQVWGRVLPPRLHLCLQVRVVDGISKTKHVLWVVCMFVWVYSFVVF
jgi:hypothetical protein